VTLEKLLDYMEKKAARAFEPIQGADSNSCPLIEILLVAGWNEYQIIDLDPLRRRCRQAGEQLMSLDERLGEVACSITLTTSQPLTFINRLSAGVSGVRFEKICLSGLLCCKQIFLLACPCTQRPGSSRDTASRFVLCSIRAHNGEAISE
jgi:hypothetical protein